MSRRMETEVAGNSSSPRDSCRSKRKVGMSGDPFPGMGKRLLSWGSARTTEVAGRARLSLGRSGPRREGVVPANCRECSNRGLNALATPFHGSVSCGFCGASSQGCHARGCASTTDRATGPMPFIAHAEEMGFKVEHIQVRKPLVTNPRKTPGTGTPSQTRIMARMGRHLERHSQVVVADLSNPRPPVEHTIIKGGREWAVWWLFSRWC